MIGVEGTVSFWVFWAHCTVLNILNLSRTRQRHVKVNSNTHWHSLKPPAWRYIIQHTFTHPGTDSARTNQQHYILFSTYASFILLSQSSLPWLRHKISTDQDPLLFMELQTSCKILYPPAERIFFYTLFMSCLRIISQHGTHVLL